MSHPDLAASPDTRPIELGEVWENPVTLERAVVVELPWMNDEGRAVAELTALPGARVVGALAPIARRRGYSGAYPTLSRVTLAPRPARDAAAG